MYGYFCQAPLGAPLQRHLIKVQALHEEDVAEGYGDVYLPYALARTSPTPGKPGGGNMSFRRRNVRGIHTQVWSGGVMSQRLFCKKS